MKPAKFAYRVPQSVDEALTELERHGSESRVLAGGMSLVRLMNSRVESPGVVIDINRIAGLDALDVDDEVIRIGALVRQRASETSDAVRRHAPVFAEAGAEVAHLSVRERGTVVGSLAFADPCGELPTALVALDGSVVAKSTRGERVIEAADFFIGPHRTALEPDEFAVEARLPITKSGRTGGAFLEVTRRHGEVPVCGVASVVELDAQDRVVTARIAIGAVADRPVRASEAERVLIGESADDAALSEAGEIAAQNVTPVGTIHGSASFRRHLAAVVTRRSLTRAVVRAREGAHHE